tara:strand:+ start:1083 stop:1613 length:531 start_codon:yes stop_codon:yes gene_type:complete
LGTNIKDKNIVNFSLIKRNYSLFSFLMIPILSLWSPSWISVMGVQPYWPIFWLLPWSILNGPIKGLILGGIIGIIVDSINNDIYSQVPGLIICGFWFGRIGELKNRYQHGLLASLGSLICGSLYFVQLFVNNFHSNSNLLVSFGLKNIFSQIFLTGLFAPVFSKCLYEMFLKNLKK